MVVFTEPTVLSVGEELIMPSDYLTIDMKVATENHDTLDIDEEDVKAGDRISLNYEIKSEYSMLVYFDCETYGGEVKLYDITSTTSKVTFESLKLNKFNEDEYIILATSFAMVNEVGDLEDFHSADMSIVNDTIKRSSGFYFYGVVTKLYPKLIKYEQMK